MNKALLKLLFFGLKGLLLLFEMWLNRQTDVYLAGELGGIIIPKLDFCHRQERARCALFCYPQTRTPSQRRSYNLDNVV